VTRVPGVLIRAYRARFLVLAAMMLMCSGTVSSSGLTYSGAGPGMTPAREMVAP